MSKPDSIVFHFRWLVVENFVPADVFDSLRERCQYDIDEGRVSL